MTDIMLNKEEVRAFEQTLNCAISMYRSINEEQAMRTIKAAKVMGFFKIQPPQIDFTRDLQSKIAGLENEKEAIRHRTLMEVARKLCTHCNNGIPAEQRGNGWWYHQSPNKGLWIDSYEPCTAYVTHNIHKADKEKIV